MSFRIDDILKRESSASPPNSAKRETTIKEQSSPPTTPPTSRDQKSTDPWFGLSHTNSILQQTLLNRNYPYYRSVSDCPNSKLYSNALYNCDKVFMPYNHLDPYADKVSAFSVYSRNRYWPMYPLTHPVVLPLPYTHYSKRKGGQVRFTASQTDALEKRFSAHKYLSPEDRRVLAESLKLTDRQVKTWFQNRRAKWRRCNVSGSDKTHENNEESEPETDICDDDTPRHEKSNTIIK